MSSLLGRWLSHTTEHGCAGVDVKSMARKGVNCRRPPPSLTRVINDRRIAKTGGSGRQPQRFSYRRRTQSGQVSWAAASAPLQQAATALAGQLDVVGGACAHPDELPRRVMTTHPAAVDASP